MEVSSVTSSNAELQSLQHANEALKCKVAELNEDKENRVAYTTELERKINTLLVVEHERDAMLRANAKDKSSDDRQTELLLAQLQATNEKAENEKIKVVKAEIEIEQLHVSLKRAQSRVNELEIQAMQRYYSWKRLVHYSTLFL